ncbi:MAG TPA: hypothetical protein VN653_04245 [Anaerolineales bacterium]|nr:hypothetical protein [Anaerolineales bacterium]
MNKIVPVMLAFILTGCSALQNLSFLQSPTPAPAIAASSPQPTVTLISAASSNTPDLFVINTEAPATTPPVGAPLATNTHIPTATPSTRPTITLEPVDSTLFTPGPVPFSLLQKSTTQLVWGSTCDGARSIKFVVQLVVPLRRLKYVTLWYRLQDKYSGRHTDWGGGAIMLDNDRGTYFYTIELDQISDYRAFEDAWLQFQFVATNIYLHHLGSSIVDRNSVSLTHCKVFNP